MIALFLEIRRLFDLSMFSRKRYLEKTLNKTYKLLI